MVAALPASEFLPAHTGGRLVETEQTVRLGDVDPTGRLRLDATARHLQDVANDDALDAGLDDAFAWVVRRTMIRIARPLELGERVRLTTFCSGTGRSWAERRTTLSGNRQGSIEAVSLWVQVDAATGRPTGLDHHFHDVYGPAAAGRRVSTRLTLPAPPPGATTSAATRRWAVRRVDLDAFGHVNNAVAWAVLHEVDHSIGAGPGTGEVEYLAPAGPGDSPLRLCSATDGSTAISAWLVAGESVRVAARWTPDPAG